MVAASAGTAVAPTATARIKAEVIVLDSIFGLPRSECDAKCNGKLVVRPVTQVFIQVTGKMLVKFAVAVGVPIGGGHVGLRHPLPLLLARGRALALDRHYHAGTARSS